MLAKEKSQERLSRNSAEFPPAVRVRLGSDRRTHRDDDADGYASGSCQGSTAASQPGSQSLGSNPASQNPDHPHLDSRTRQPSHRRQSQSTELSNDASSRFQTRFDYGGVCCELGFRCCLGEGWNHWLFSTDVTGNDLVSVFVSARFKTHNRR